LLHPLEPEIGINALEPASGLPWWRTGSGSVAMVDFVAIIKQERIQGMLYTVAVVLILLWLLGLISSYTINGFIHILLVIAIILVLVRIISGRKPL
jgi:hypothetical protein